MADLSASLAVVDATEQIVENGPTVRGYELYATIEGQVAVEGPEELGPRIHALYAQALRAVLEDASLGGLCDGVIEGETEEEAEADAVPALQLAIDRVSALEGGGGCTGGFVLQLTIPWERREGEPHRREAILAALMARVAANAPTSDLAVTEKVSATLRGLVETSLGFPLFRNSHRPETIPAVVMIDGDQRADHSRTGRTGYAKDITFEVMAADEAELEDLSERVRSAVHNAHRLAGLAADTEEDQIDPEVNDVPYTGPGMFAALPVRVTFATVPGNPYAEAG